MSSPTATPHNESPDRRPRRPNIPLPFKSETFNAATHALQIINENENNNDGITNKLSSLRILRDEISQHLHNIAPEWKAVTSGVSSLNQALHTTQSISKLHHDTAIQRNESGSEMAYTVHKTNQLSTNINVANCVRDFIQLLNAAGIPDSVIKSPIPVQVYNSEDDVGERESPDRFLQRAAALHRARVAGSTEPLKNMKVLDSARQVINMEHTKLQQTLENILKNAIFNVHMHNNVISHQTLSSIVQAVDLLGGPNHSSIILKQICTHRLISIIHKCLYTCSHQQNFYQGEQQISFDGEDRTICYGLFEDVLNYMMIILNRLTNVAEYIESEECKFYSTIKVIWKSMQSILATFIHTTFQFSSSPSSSSASRISLLPSKNDKKSTTNNTATATPSSSSLEGDDCSINSLICLIKNISTILKPSIYNLEVCYNQLHKFIMMSTRLQHSWTPNHKSSPSKKHDMKLTRILGTAVELFMKTIHKDIETYVGKYIIGNRTGTLLVQNPNKKIYKQTEMMINLISSCLKLTVCIPGMTNKIGELINNEIITPFTNRTCKALDLVSTWTDSNILINQIMDNNSNDKDYSKIKEGVNGDAIFSKCLEQSHGDDDKCVFKILCEDEWNSVVGLISNCKMIICQLEQCIHISENEGLEVDGVLDCGLFDILKGKGMVSGDGKLKGPVKECIKKTHDSCRKLKHDAIDRGLVLLHCEIVLHSFKSVVTALDHRQVTHNRHDESEEKLLEVEMRKEEEGENTEEDDGDGNEDGDEYGDEYGDERMTDGVSSIFKALPVELSDVQNGRKEGHDNVEDEDGLNEFDEFGDLITSNPVSTTPTSTATKETKEESNIEEQGFPNSLLLEHGWGISSVQPAKPKAKSNMAKPSKKKIEGMTDADKKVMEAGKGFGQSIKWMNEYLESNIGKEDSKYIMNEADHGIGLGIKLSGRRSNSGDVVANGARLFLDFTAGLAGECLGWPTVDNDFSVAEGASQSASECRALLYAAGLL